MKKERIRLCFAPCPASMVSIGLCKCQNMIKQSVKNEKISKKIHKEDEKGKT